MPGLLDFLAPPTDVTGLDPSRLGLLRFIAANGSQGNDASSPFGGLPQALGLLAQGPQAAPQGLLAPNGDLPAPGAQPMGGTMPAPADGGFAFPGQSPQGGAIPFPVPRPADLSGSPMPRPAPAPAMASQPQGAAVPFPTPRPADLSGAPAPTQPGPTLGADGKPPSLASQFASGADRLLSGIGNIYGNGGSGDAMINLGLALSSPGNRAENLARAAAATSALQTGKQQQLLNSLKISQQLGGQQGNIAILKQAFPNMTDAQLVAAAQQPALVQEAFKRTNPSEQYETFTRDGTTFQRDRITGKETKLDDAEESWSPLLGADRAKYGIPATDMTPYQISSTGKIQAAGTPTTTINTAPGPAKSVYDTVSERTDAARSAAASLPSFSEARRLVNSGQITLGAGADARVAMQKVGALFGMDPTSASNSETFRSVVAPQVLALVKGLGAGSGISNADRDFAAQAAGGNISLEPQTINRLLDIGERAARYSVDSHNRTVDRVYPEGDPNNTQVRSLFKVEVPEFAQPQTTSPAPAPSGTTTAPGAPARKFPSFKIID